MRKGRTNQLDAWLWKLYCSLWDNRCLAPDCRGTSKRLVASKPVRDHIIAYADGGPGDLWNTQPLCRSCNSRYKRNSQDWRGEGWREKFVASLAQELKANLDIYMCGISGDVRTYTEDAEGNQNAELVLLYSPQKAALEPTTQHMQPNIHHSKQEAAAIVNKLILRLKETPFVFSKHLPYSPPPFPPEKRQEQLRILIIQHGKEVFWGAAMEFLKEQSWLPDNEQGHQKNSFYAWEPLCECFPAYVAEYHDFLYRNRDKLPARGASTKRTSVAIAIPAETKVELLSHEDREAALVALEYESDFQRQQGTLLSN